MKTMVAILVQSGMAALLAARCAGAREREAFRIHVVDDATGRGVPLVELATTGSVIYVTDSAGMIAFDEPGLFDQDVFFTVKAHGYSYPKDGFGFAGVRLRPAAGGAAVVEVERVNIAERLYRVTGGGIYRDSVLLGDAPPIAQPLLNGRVLGQDSVQNAIYRGKLYWFWGDTNRPAYPLGQFAMSGAVSELPGVGGLDPSLGVNLAYFVGADGFSRPMLPIPDMPGPVWADGLTVVRDPRTGRERLLCHWVRVKELGTLYEQGFAEYDPAKDVFEPVQRFPLDAPLYMRGHPLRVRDAAAVVGGAGGSEWFYFPFPFPITRVRADVESLLDPGAYEAYTCLRAGARYEKERSALERDVAGRLVYGWKRGTAALAPAEEAELVRAGLMRPEEALTQTRDIETGKKVQVHSASVYWNAYRERWVMIGQEIWGSSPLGEVWFVEADTPLGPWVYARKVVTHDDYSFYNVKQHPYFDAEGGRIVYFEGTYTTFMTDAKPTPRYDYNQVMYRLDLADPRLVLPVPVYRVRGLAGAGGREYGEVYLTGRGVARAGAWERVLDSPFAVLPRRDAAAAPRSGLARLSVAYSAVPGPEGGLWWPSLVVTRAGEGSGPDAAAGGRLGGEASPAEWGMDDEIVLGWVSLDAGDAGGDLAPLYEYGGGDTPRRVFSTRPQLAGLERSPAPLCHVWQNPCGAAPCGGGAVDPLPVQ